MKMSKMLTIGLVSLALAAGCKKEDKGGGGCDDVGKKMKSAGMAKMPKDAPDDAKKMMEEMSGKAADLVVKHCKDDKWSADSIKCAKEADDPKTCMTKLSADQQSKLMEDMSKLGGVAVKKEEPVKEPEPTPTPTEEPPKEEPAPAPTEGGGEAPAPAAGGTGLANCDAYIAATEKYMACDKVPQSARDAAKQGIEAMKSGWGDMSAVDDATKKQIDDGCAQGADALKQAASAMGCEL